MKKLAFVAWWDWFNHTKSADFLVESLKKDFIIEKFSRPNWTMKHNPNIHELNKNNFDTILFFYELPPARYLHKLSCKNIVWVPMYDSQKGLILAKTKFLFYKFLNIKVICFSKKIIYELNPFFNCKYFQYFPKPKKQIKFNKKRLLFWERRDELEWDFLRNNIINENDFDSILIKQNKDGLAKKNIKIKETTKIKITNKWLSEREYDKIMDSNNIFVAPRLKEGIGHSFLNVLSRGYIVIANNDSTMNEYIENEKTGFLFDYNKPKKIDLSNKIKLKKVSNNCYSFMKKGYKEWTNKQKELIDWISN